ncbi:solute carrier family 23 member 1-like [Styela clava]
MNPDYSATNHAFDSEESPAADTNGKVDDINIQPEVFQSINESKSLPEKNELGLLYKLEDRPAWHLSAFLGIQHCFLAIGGLIGMPLLLAPRMCMTDTAVGYLGRAMVLNSLFFIAGILTFLQTTFGTRLPILQGGSFTFLPSTLAILALPHNTCPLGPVNPNITNGSFLYNDTDGMLVDGTELWQRRMREIQGAIAVASVVEFVLAITGAIGFLMRFIGPLTVAPSIALIGLSLFNAASYNASGQWGIAVFTIVVLIIFSQYMRNIKLPVPVYTRSKGCHVVKTNFFKLFPVLITIVLSWLLCLILTETGALPDNPNEVGYRGRTDVRISVLQNSPWFRFPYPGQWGLPTVSGAGVAGMLAGVLAGIVESIGDYYACARMSGAPPIPEHAINRGLAIEGFGCILAGVIGTGTGSTSYSENIGAIGISRVGSRRVLQVAGVIFFIVGMLGKFGAVLVLIPDPVIGGLFCVMFGMIAAVGLSNLQHVDLNSARNLFIIGFSIFMGLMVPIWVTANSKAIDTGNKQVDQIFLVLLETSIFVGGALGAILDNTIPGTPEERGLTSWNKASLEFESENMPAAEYKKYKKRMENCYNLPFSTKWRFSKYIPILPEFRKKQHDEDENTQL